MSTQDYHRYILQPVYNVYLSSCKENLSELEPLTSELNISETPKYITQNSKILSVMTLVRHHEFPSPLLDWSRSWYIAAYFAFKNLDPLELMKEENKDKKVAIYVFVDSLTGGKTSSLSCPHICTIGPNMLTHSRHHVQQAEYTFCVCEKNKDLYYVKDQNAFDSRIGECQQDICYKIILPASERDSVLEEPNKMNINEFSLFGTEDALMCKLKEDYRKQLLLRSDIFE